MNCSEVMELMQRQLDHDLNESEQSLLTEHLNSCAACTEMFERLKMLNDGLEQLPRVMPKISLVDSIMPQLDEIDRLNAIQDQANVVKQTEDQAQRPELMPLTVKGHKVSQDAQDGDQTLVRNRRWLERINWRTTSAVIAAGLVFGLFMVNYEPVVQESADFAELSSKNSEQKSDAADSNAIRMMDEEKATLKSSTDAAGTPETTAAADLDSAPVADPPIVPDQSIADSTEGGSSQDASSDRIKTMDEPATRIAESDQSAGTEKSLTENTPKSDQNQPSSTANNDNHVQEVDSMALNPATIPAEKDNSDENSGMRSTYGITNPLQAVSPDQKHEAVWDQGQLMVMKKDGETSSLLQSMTWKTEPTEIRWSEDSRHLTIVSVNDAGQLVEVSYELSAKGLKQIKVTKSDLPSQKSSSRNMDNDSDNSTNMDVLSNTGTADSAESSLP